MLMNPDFSGCITLLKTWSLSTGEKKMLIKNFENIFLLGKFLFNIV